jgi:hypothetical protein
MAGCNSAANVYYKWWSCVAGLVTQCIQYNYSIESSIILASILLFNEVMTDDWLHSWLYSDSVNYSPDIVILLFHCVDDIPGDDCHLLIVDEVLFYSRAMTWLICCLHSKYCYIEWLPVLWLTLPVIFIPILWWLWLIHCDDILRYYWYQYYVDMTIDRWCGGIYMDYCYSIIVIILMTDIIYCCLMWNDGILLCVY